MILPHKMALPSSLSLTLTAESDVLGKPGYVVIFLAVSNRTVKRSSIACRYSWVENLKKKSFLTPISVGLTETAINRCNYGNQKITR